MLARLRSMERADVDAAAASVAARCAARFSVMDELEELYWRRERGVTRI